MSKLKQDYSKVSTSVDDLGKSLRIQQRNEKMKNLDCQEKKIKSRTSVYNCQLKVTVKPEEVTLRKAAREGVSVQLVFTNIWTRKTCYRERTKLIFSMGLLSNLYERAMIGVLENTCLSFDLSQILSQSHCSDWWRKSKLILKYFQELHPRFYWFDTLWFASNAGYAKRHCKGRKCVKSSWFRIWQKKLSTVRHDCAIPRYHCIARSC